MKISSQRATFNGIAVAETPQIVKWKKVVPPNPDVGKRHSGRDDGVFQSVVPTDVLARARGMHAKSRCPVNRAQQAISSFVKETESKYRNGQVIFVPESDAEKSSKLTWKKQSR